MNLVNEIEILIPGYRLCCLPIQIKSMYYPWALLVMFTLFFGFQLELFVGLAVGYMNIYGLVKRFEISSTKAKQWESKFPFKKFSGQPGKLS